MKHLRALNAVHLYSIMPYLLIPVLATLISCGGQFPLSVSLTPSLSPTLTGTNAPTVTLTPSLTPVPTATQTITVTPTPTVTPTRTIYWTPTITLTPTFDFPDARALMQANCRYGPGKAYLYSHGLYEGDRSEVQGRNPSGIWLWIKPENLERHCWAAASVLEVSGDIQTVAVVRSELPFSAFYGPPDDVEAERNGDQVRVSWSRVDMTQDDDRGYLIEAIVCQNGQLVGVAAQTDDTSLQFTDENTCSGESSGKLYTVDKHGYSEPVDIPWP